MNPYATLMPPNVGNWFNPQQNTCELIAIIKTLNRIIIIIFMIFLIHNSA